MNTMAEVTIKQEKLDQEYLESELQLNQPQHDIEEQVSCKEEDSSQNRYESYNIKEEFEESEEDFCGQKEAPRHNFEKYNVSCKEEQQVEGKEEYTIYYMKEEVEEEHASNHDSDSSCGSNMTPKRALNQTIEAQSLFNSELSEDSSLAPRVAGKEGNIEVEKEFKTKEPTAERSHDERRKSYTGIQHDELSNVSNRFDENHEQTKGDISSASEKSISEEKYLQCSECKKGFTQKGHLNVHMRSHTGEKPYQCTECNKRFAQNCALKDHIRTHTGEKPFQCSECDKEFAQNLTLKRHMRTHAGERPYQCTECKKRFAQKGTLNDHMRTHTQEKPFQCTECNKIFAQNGSLKTHMRTHTGEKPYQC